MTRALNTQKLQQVYDHAAWRYDWQHGLLTAFSDQRGRRCLVRMAVQTGDKVLDAGGGTGSTALLAAAQVGETGRVTLADISEGMLAQARARARSKGLAERIDCVEGDIFRFPFAEGSFDAVLSTYSLCPVQRPDRAALALYRLVKPGGRLGIAHSADPRNPVVRALAQGIEHLIVHWPALSLGCRSIDVVETLEAAGAVKRFDRMLGVPLWPFRVLVFEKPGSASGP